MQQLKSLLEPGSMTTLARFCQHCTGSLLNIIIDLKILLITYKALNGLAPQYRLPDFMRVKKLWMGWVVSLMMLQGHLQILLLYISCSEGRSVPVTFLASFTTLCKAFLSCDVLVPNHTAMQQVNTLSTVHL